LIGAITNIGFNIGKPRFFNQQYEDLKLDHILESKSFWIWSLIWSGLYIFFTMLWIGGI
jgi:hypothetical protein